ncbi:MFS transporter [Dictyobacter aurantiacus]|uniref:MFS transporter n=1 Tax=Dictyobacter aurantiacus TaxID=1936993 RepID=A0A401ZSK1_9CHLR|nr:MFS transporter [Dictyobacter aurantiacus]
MVTAYALAFGGFLLLGGRLADLFGQRRLFLAGLMLFILASFAGGLAPFQLWLIAARAAQGLGAALVAPTVLSLIMTLFTEESERNSALGIFGAIDASGFSAGVLFGGLLTNAWGWRWVLFVNVPIGIAVMIFAPFFLPKGQRVRKRLDIIGALIVTIAFTLLVFVLSTVNTSAWDWFIPTGLVMTAFLLLVVFLLIECRIPDPLIHLGIFRRRSFTGAILLAATLGASSGTVLFVLTLYMQEILHYSPLQTGLAFLPLGLIVVITATRIPKVIARFGRKTSLVGGPILLMAGMLLLSRISVTGTFLKDILPGELLFGMGVGTMIVAATSAVTSGVRKDEQGTASGLFNTAQQIGLAIGLALAVAIETAQTTVLVASRPAISLVDGFDAALLAAAVLAVLAIMIGAFVFRRADTNQ